MFPNAEVKGNPSSTFIVSSTVFRRHHGRRRASEEWREGVGCTEGSVYCSALLLWGGEARCVAYS